MSASAKAQKSRNPLPRHDRRPLTFHEIRRISSAPLSVVLPSIPYFRTGHNGGGKKNIPGKNREIYGRALAFLRKVWYSTGIGTTNKWLSDTEQRGLGDPRADQSRTNGVNRIPDAASRCGRDQALCRRTAVCGWISAVPPGGHRCLLTW